MKDKLFKKAIAWAEKKGFQKIKSSHIEDLESTRTFSKSSSDKVITPDVTGIRMGRKSFIQIALKSDNKQEIITKWKLFCTLASRKGGKLYLLAARGHKSFAQNIVKDYNLSNAQVVSI